MVDLTTLTTRTMPSIVGQADLRQSSTSVGSNEPDDLPSEPVTVVVTNTPNDVFAAGQMLEIDDSGMTVTNPSSNEFSFSQMCFKSDEPSLDLSQCPENKQDVAQELMKGNIPEEMMEDLRLISCDSETGIAFNEAMTEFAKIFYRENANDLPFEDRFYKCHNFNKHPVRFMLADTDDINAYYVPYTQPPIITLSKALFREVTVGGQKTYAIKDKRELAEFIIHEMTHLKIRQRYGMAFTNTKFEEGFAETLPLEIMLDAGLDMNDVLNDYIKLLGLTSGGKKESKWEHFVDVHVLPKNLESILEIALGALRSTKGDFTHHIKTIDGIDRKFQAVITATNNLPTMSYVKGKLPDGYNSLPPEEKIAHLQKVVSGFNGKFYQARIDDVYEELKKIREEVRNLNKTNDKKITTAVDSFCNNLLKLVEMCSPTKTKRLYLGASDIVSKGIGLKPQGDLRKSIDTAFANFIDEVTANNGTEIINTAQDIVEVMENEPLLKTPNGLELLKSIDWTQFTIPDEVGNKVPWKNIYCHLNDPNVLRAAIYMGLDGDNNIRNKINECEVLDVSMQYFGLVPAGVLVMSIIPICSRKFDVLDISLQGKVTNVHNASKEDDSNIDSQIYALNALLDAGLGDSLSDVWCEEFSSSNLNELNGLIGLELLTPTNYKKFFYLNCNPTINYNLLRPVLNQIAERIPQKHLEEVVSFFLSFGIVAGGRDLSNRLSVFNIVKDFLLEPRHSFSQAFIYKQLLDLCCEIYDTKLGEFNTEQAKDFIGEMRNMFPTDDKFSNFSSWGDYLKVAKECNIKGSLHVTADQLYTYTEKAILLQQAMILLEDKAPTIHEVAQFIDVFKYQSVYRIAPLNKIFQGVIVKRTSSLRKNTNNLERRITSFKILCQGNLIKPSLKNEIYKELIQQIQVESSPEKRIKFYENLLSRDRILNPKINKEVIELWSCDIRELYGTDIPDNLKIVKNIKTVIDRVGGTINRFDQLLMFQEMSKKIEAQKTLCDYIVGKLSALEKKDVKQGGFVGILSDASLHLIGNRTDLRNALYEFIKTPLNNESIEKVALALKCIWKNEITFEIEDEDEKGSLHSFERMLLLHFENFNQMQGDFSDPKDFELYEKVKEHLIDKFTALHDHFWAAPIELQAIFAKYLLVGNEIGQTADNNPILAQAISDSFPGNSGKPIQQFAVDYIEELHPSEQGLVVGALATSSSGGGHKTLELGEALAKFAERKDPATIKCAQIASSHPDTPPEIRKHLKRLKNEVAERFRWIMIEEVEKRKVAITDEYNKYRQNQGLSKCNDVDHDGNVYIKHIGKIRGVGSLNEAIELYFSDGTRRILSLVKPYAYERAITGFDTLERTISKSQDNNVKDTMGEIICQARRKVGVEVNCSLAKNQYDIGRKINNGITVTVDGEVFPFHAPEVLGVGNDFYLMEEVEGRPFVALAQEVDAGSLPRIKKMSMAILTKELVDIFKGVFCNDRHAGNIHMDGNNVNNIDYKALSLEDWNQDGYSQFAKILFSLIIDGGLNKDNFSEKLIHSLKQIRDSGESIEPYVSEAEKGLLSLTDYLEHLDEGEIKRVLFSAIIQGINPGEKMFDAILNLELGDFKSKVEELLRNKTIPLELANLLQFNTDQLICYAVAS